MDAVELTLPAAVVVSKFLGSDVFPRVRESEAGESAGASSSAGVCIFSGQDPTSSRADLDRDESCPDKVTECNLVSRRNSGVLKSISPTGSKRKENGLRKMTVHNNCSSWGKCDNGELRRKSLKRRSSPTQARTGLLNVSLDSCSVKDDSSDQFRSAKNKRSQESRRRERRSPRTTVKAKLDAKDNLVNSHLTVNGNRGTFGFKYDHLDFAKSVDEIPLNDLLDGNFSGPPSNSYQERAKKASNSNDNTLLSIRKAASVLTASNGAGTSGSWKAPGILDSASNCHKEGSCPSASPFFIPHQANVHHSPVFQPKDILKMLGLSSKHAVDSLKGVRDALPPFPWTVPSKPAVDSGKSTMSRSFCHGKWVRLGSSSCLMGEERGCFPELDLKLGDPVQGGASAPLYLVGSSDAPSPSTSREPPPPVGRGSGPMAGETELRESTGFPPGSSPTLEGSSSGCCSPRVMVAAEILCGMATRTGKARMAGPCAGEVSAQKSPAARDEKKKKKNRTVDIPPLLRCSVPTAYDGRRRHGSAAAPPGHRGKECREMKRGTSGL